MRRLLLLMLLAAAGLLACLQRQNRALREEAERLAANYRAMTDTVISRRSASGRSVRAVQTLALSPEELTAPLFAPRLATVSDIGVKTKRVNELTTVGTETRVEVKLLPEPKPLPASPEGEECDDDNMGMANGVGAMDVSTKRSAAEFGANVIARSDDRATTMNIADRATTMNGDNPATTSYKYHDPWVDITVDIGSTPFADDAGQPLPTSPEGEESDVDDSEGPLPTSPEGEESDVDDSEALPFRGGLGGAAISLTVRDTLTLVEHRVPRRIWFIRFGTKCVKREVVASCPYTEVVMAERVVVAK
jgi:hypothetical protein